jgi:hypothetical protein
MEVAGLSKMLRPFHKTTGRNSPEDSALNNQPNIHPSKDAHTFIY